MENKEKEPLDELLAAAKNLVAQYRSSYKDNCLCGSCVLTTALDRYNHEQAQTI